MATYLYNLVCDLTASGQNEKDGHFNEFNGGPILLQSQAWLRYGGTGDLDFDRNGMLTTPLDSTKWSVQVPNAPPQVLSSQVTGSIGDTILIRIVDPLKTTGATLRLTSVFGSKSRSQQSQSPFVNANGFAVSVFAPTDAPDANGRVQQFFPALADGSWTFRIGATTAPVNVTNQYEFNVGATIQIPNGAPAQVTFGIDPEMDVTGI